MKGNFWLLKSVLTVEIANFLGNIDLLSPSQRKIASRINLEVVSEIKERINKCNPDKPEISTLTLVVTSLSKTKPQISCHKKHENDC